MKKEYIQPEIEELIILPYSLMTICLLLDCLYPIPCHHDAHCSDDEHKAEADAGSELFGKNRHAKEPCSERFQGTEDGGGGGTDTLDGSCGAEERDGCGEEAQRQRIAP